MRLVRHASQHATVAAEILGRYVRDCQCGLKAVRSVCNRTLNGVSCILSLLFEQPGQVPIATKESGAMMPAVRLPDGDCAHES